MKGSRVLQQLRAGKVATCTKVNLDSSRAVEMAAMAGVDCIWLCTEHVPNDWSLLERQVLAAKSQGADAMIRIARGSYSDYVRPFEMDAAGSMVPHVMSLEDAEYVVRTTRFHPIGRRPIDGGNADGDFTGVGMIEYMEHSNREKFVAIQIEDPEPLDDLDKIAELDGIDIIFFGPADFSQGIGAPGKWDDPRIIKTRKRVAEVAVKNGKFAGTPGSPDTLDQLVDMGYRFIPMGADVLALVPYFREIARRLTSLNG